MSKIFKYLAPFIAIGFILFSSYFYDEVPYLKESILGLWILITIYFYFIKVPNLQEKSLYLTTQNDHGAMYGNLILGLFMIVGGSFYYYYTQVFHLFLWLLMFQSALLIFLNFYKKTETKGLSFKIKDEQLEYFIGKEHKKMTLQEIEHVHIQKDEIIISQGEQKKSYLSFLELSPEEMKETASFFRSILNPKAVTVEN